MKSDVLTVAAVVFIVSVAVSGLGLTDMFAAEASEPPTELQQGVITARSEY